MTKKQKNWLIWLFGGSMIGTIILCIINLSILDNVFPTGALGFIWGGLWAVFVIYKWGNFPVGESES